MDPNDPLDARQIVVQYARLLEHDLTENRHPARIDSLPFAKPVIKTAIRTSIMQLTSAGQLTSELRDYFETAYTYLAEYLEPELVELMTEYRRSAEQLTHEPISAHERTRTSAWQTLAGSATLAGEIARAAATEAEELRNEFHSIVTSK